MQSILLVICLFWKRRQHKLQIDDFGNPLSSEDSVDAPQSPIPIRRGTQLDREGLSIAASVETAVDSDVRVEHGVEHEILVPAEDTPLLNGAKKPQEHKKGFWARLLG